MLFITPPIFQRRRRYKSSRNAVVPVAPLTLTAASYVVSTSVTLVFDRAIDIASLDASTIEVFDGVHALRQLRGTMGTLTDARTVRINLSIVGHAGGTQVLLNASEDNGIVASDDGGMWSGASGVVLPFP